MAVLNYSETSRTRVKICGMLRPEDVRSAVVAGADALGFVFFEKSPRNVSIMQAREMVRQVPAFVTTTALFVNPDAEFVREVISQLKVDLLQFHGDESVAFCEQFDRPYIKAIRMKEDTDVVALSKEYCSSQGLLLDAYVKGVPGGTGESFNWDLISLECQKDVSLPIVLAGGLNAENIATAIKAVSPWAVDVSGGVEAEPGVKDSSKIKRFIDVVSATNKIMI